MNGPERNRAVTAVWKVGLQRWLRPYKESDQEAFCHQLTASPWRSCFVTTTGETEINTSAVIWKTVCFCFIRLYSMSPEKFLSSLAFLFFVYKPHAYETFISREKIHTLMHRSWPLTLHSHLRGNWTDTQTRAGPPSLLPERRNMARKSNPHCASTSHPAKG